MAGFRLYSSYSRWSAIVLPLAVCSGCWEKIEYKGPRTTATTSPSASTPQPTPPASPPETAPPPDVPVAVIPETPAADSSASAPVATDSASTATVGDRYTTPTATDVPPTDYPPGITPSAETLPNATPSSTPPAAADPPRHTDAVAASASQSAQNPPALTARHAAWLLGSRLSLAALANDRGVATQNVPVWFADAQAAAKFLGTTINDLPQPAAKDDSSPASRQVIDYLATANGKRIGQELSKSHTAEESALFEVALKSNILLLLYTPNSSAGNAISAAITAAAPKAKLPSELWQPLVDALNKQAPPADVRAAVKKLHIDVDQYLSQRAEPKG